MKALLKGHKVLFAPVAQMLRELNFGRADNSYYYLKPDLLILDELGFKKLPGYSADGLRGYCQTPTNLLTNGEISLPITPWPPPS